MQLTMNECQVCEPIKMIKRGRPKKEPVEKGEIIVKKLGRPKIIQVDSKTYQKEYYEIHKEKTKGIIICEVCQVYHSKSNKSRHIQSKYHQEHLMKSY